MAFFHSWPSLVGASMVMLLHMLLCGHSVDAEIVVKDLDSNETAAIFPDMQASFGKDFPEHGLKGRVVLAQPRTGCGLYIKQAPKSIDHYGWILLIERGECTFVEKVLNAQEANFSSAIVYNSPGDQALTRMGGDNGSGVYIPSTFVGYNTGMDLKAQYSYPRFKNFVVDIKEEEEVDYRMYLLPFAIVVGVCFFMVMVFLVVKFVRDHTRTRVARLSKRHLKKIPIRKFKKGQYYDTCAICLDEYEDGEKIRVLPCEHAYHAKCIDPWLTRNKKTCPVCKRRVIPGKDPNSEESGTDSDEGGSSQTTPLLMNATTQRSHGSMNQVEGDSGPTPRAQSAPPLFEATVVLEAEGAVGGVGINHMSDGGSSSTSHGVVKMGGDLLLEHEGVEQKEGRRKRKERREEEDRLLLGTEEDEEEEERRKAERKERRKKKKEKKKKSKKSSGGVGDASGNRDLMDGGGLLLGEPGMDVADEGVALNNAVGGDDGRSSVGLPTLGPLTDGPAGGALVNSAFMDSQEEVVVPSSRRGKKREMSEVV